MKNFLYIPLILVAFASCRKDNSTTQPAQSTQTSDSSKNTIAKMNGTWIWMGGASQYYSPRWSDAFTRYSVLAIDSSAVMIWGIKYDFDSFDAGRQCYQYKLYQHSPFSHDYVYYYPIENRLARDWGNNYNYGSLSTGLYKPNHSLKDYIPFMVGAKTLTGTAYDTALYRTPIDSSYAISTMINFTAIDDTTIVYDKDFFGIDDDTLHYKMTDEATQTVVFQNFHVIYPDYSTLTYNYATRSLIFEQQIQGNGWSKYLKLQ